MYKKIEILDLDFFYGRKHKMHKQDKLWITLMLWIKTVEYCG